MWPMRPSVTGISQQALPSGWSSSAAPGGAVAAVVPLNYDTQPEHSHAVWLRFGIWKRGQQQRVGQTGGRVRGTLFILYKTSVDVSMNKCTIPLRKITGIAPRLFFKNKSSRPA